MLGLYGPLLQSELDWIAIYFESIQSQDKGTADHAGAEWRHQGIISDGIVMGWTVWLCLPDKAKQNLPRTGCDKTSGPLTLLSGG